MKIQVLNVSVSTPVGKKYQVAEVAYKNLEKGTVEGKKIMSFVNKDVFNRVSQAKSGDELNVSLAKDDNGYWQWNAIIEGDAQVKVEKAQVTAANPTPRSNYETPEERALRQIMIVRQSSISSAVEFVNGGSKTADHTPEKVLEVAKTFERYVLDAAGHLDPVEELKMMKDDMPE